MIWGIIFLVNSFISLIYLIIRFRVMKTVEKVFITILVLASLIIGLVFCTNVFYSRDKENDMLYRAANQIREGEYLAARAQLEGISDEQNIAAMVLETIISFAEGDEFRAGASLYVLNELELSSDVEELLGMISTENMSIYDVRSDVIQIFINDIIRPVSKKLIMESDILYNKSLNYSEEQYIEEFGEKEWLKNIAMQSEIKKYDVMLGVAADIVKKRGSRDNKYLLAEVVCEALADEVDVNIYEFRLMLDDEYDINEDKEYLDYIEKFDEYNEDLEGFYFELKEIKTDSATEQYIIRNIETINNKIYELELENKNKLANLLVEYIDISNDAKSRLLTSMIYNSIGDKVKAISILEEDGNAFNTFLERNLVLRDSIEEIIRQYHDVKIMNYSDYIYMYPKIARYTIADNSKSVNDLLNTIISQNNYRFNQIKIESIDYANYPTVDLTISGNDDFIDRIINKNNVVMRDTQKEVDYTVKDNNQNINNSSIGIIIDINEKNNNVVINDIKESIMSLPYYVGAEIEIGLFSSNVKSKEITNFTHEIADITGGITRLEIGDENKVSDAFTIAVSEMDKTAVTKIVFLLTDGLEEIDTKYITSFAEDNNIVVIPIEYGNQSKLSLMELASNTGGEYVEAYGGEGLANVHDIFKDKMCSSTTVQYEVLDNKGCIDRSVYIGIDDVVNSRIEYGISELVDSIPVNIEQADERLSYTIYENHVQVTYDNRRTRLFRMTVDDIDAIEDISVDGIEANYSYDSGVVSMIVNKNIPEGRYDLIIEYKDGTTDIAKEAILVGDIIYANKIVVDDNFKIVIVRDEIVGFDSKIINVNNSIILEGDLRINDLLLTEDRFIINCADEAIILNQENEEPLLLETKYVKSIEGSNLYTRSFEREGEYGLEEVESDITYIEQGDFIYEYIDEQLFVAKQSLDEEE